MVTTRNRDLKKHDGRVHNNNPLYFLASIHVYSSKYCVAVANKKRRTRSPTNFDVEEGALDCSFGQDKKAVVDGPLPNFFTVTFTICKPQLF